MNDTYPRLLHNQHRTLRVAEDVKACLVRPLVPVMMTNAGDLPRSYLRRGVNTMEYASRELR